MGVKNLPTVVNAVHRLGIEPAILIACPTLYHCAITPPSQSSPLIFLLHMYHTKWDVKTCSISRPIHSHGAYCSWQLLWCRVADERLHERNTGSVDVITPETLRKRKLDNDRSVRASSSILLSTLFTLLSYHHKCQHLRVARWMEVSSGDQFLASGWPHCLATRIWFI